ncbi:hypothetical protein STEG23_018232 [Scotinomys teguina]
MDCSIMQALIYQNKYSLRIQLHCCVARQLEVPTEIRKAGPNRQIAKRVNCEDAERPMWLPERCVRPVDVPADTNDHEDDRDSTNIGTGAMDVGKESPSTNSKIDCDQ